MSKKVSRIITLMSNEWASEVVNVKWLHKDSCFRAGKCPEWVQVIEIEEVH